MAAKLSRASSSDISFAPPRYVGLWNCTLSSSQPHTSQISKVPGGSSESVGYQQHGHANVLTRGACGRSRGHASRTFVSSQRETTGRCPRRGRRSRARASVLQSMRRRWSICDRPRHGGPRDGRARVERAAHKLDSARPSSGLTSKRRLRFREEQRRAASRARALTDSCTLRQLPRADVIRIRPRPRLPHGRTPTSARPREPPPRTGPANRPANQPREPTPRTDPRTSPGEVRRANAASIPRRAGPRHLVHADRAATAPPTLAQ